MVKKKIFNILLTALVMIAFAATGIAKDDLVNSKWAANPASIDGMNTEWGDVPMNKFKKAKVEYAFMNGQDDLFILFIFKDPNFLSSINWTGLTVWISPQGEKNKDLGINFIKKQISADDYIAMLEKQVGQPMPEDRKAQIRQNEAYYLFDQRLINKKAPDYDNDAEMPRYNGAVFRNNVVQKAVLYECAISLSELAELAPEIGAEPGKGFSLNFEWGGATKEYKEALSAGLARQQTSARAGNATGSLTGERRGGGLGDMDPERATSSQARLRRQLQRVKEYDFWVDLNLAQNK
jgi:hypothetical protein